MVWGPSGDTDLDDRSPSVERRFVRATLASKLFGSEVPATVGGYELLHRAGAGGMGLVFEAKDTRTGQRVALKVLRRRGNDALQRLKQEFRTLAELNHRHLVQLYELSLDGEHPFLTMEFVNGESLLRYVNPNGQLDVDRLRRAMGQLVAAVSAMHRAGLVHRDVKPSNLIVDPDGRLVVLDFGLACVLGEQAETPGVISGTPLYMAPERLQGAPAAEAADWFSMGAILAEALGAPLPVLPSGTLDLPELTKALNALPSDVPPDLVRVNTALVAEGPAERPDGAELRSFFGVTLSPVAAPLRVVATDDLFVGRERELELLEQSFARAQAGAFAMVYLGGEPGIGKTALASHFVERLRLTRPVMLLSSRCYEREFIAYNAVDGLIDALVKEIKRLPAEQRTILSLNGTAELLRLFPALRRVLPERRDDDRAPTAREPQTVRQRAFEALRALLLNLGANRTIVIHLDDLQWGDIDSAHVLGALLRSPAPAPLFLIASYRNTEGDQSASLRALREVQPAGSENVRTIELGHLDAAPALQLASALCGQELSSSELGSLIDESAGSPLFLRLLIQHRQQASEASAERGVRLPELMLSMLQRLSDPSRQLLQLSALAGRPLHPKLLLRAADLAMHEVAWPEQLLTLQRLGLLRRVQTAERPSLETYHDRLREIVREALPSDEKRRYHALLVDAALGEDEGDPEFLAAQCEGAGQLERAAHFAEAAGDRAFETIALERSVKYYEQALSCLNGARPPELVRKVADASAYTGRSADVATLYLELADGAEGRVALDFRLRAAELLVRGGLIDQSVRVATPVLRAVGLRYPISVRAARRATAKAMTRIGMLPLDANLVRRTPTDLEHLRIEVCFSLGYRLSIMDPARAGLLLVRGLGYALECGTDAQFARALACHALMLATLDQDCDAYCDSMLQRALELAYQLPDKETVGWVLFFKTVMDFNRTRFYRTLHVLRDAQRWIAAHLVDSGWLLQELDLGAGAQLAVMGEISELDEVSKLSLQRAEEVGNLFQAVGIRCHRGFVRLAHDEPRTVIVEMDEVIRAWSESSSHHLVAMAIWLKLHALLYLDDGPAAMLLLQEYWQRFERAGFTRSPPWAVGLPLFKGTIALACAAGSSKREHLRTVARTIVSLRTHRSTFARPAASLLEAGLLRARGKLARAAALYAAAAEDFEAQKVGGYAVVARVRQAELTDADSARALRERAHDFFQAQGIIDGAAWTRMYAPVASSVAEPGADRTE